MANRSLYDTDIVAWSEQQAEALRDLARQAGKQSNAIDWVNLIDEVETVGRSEVRAAVSGLRQIYIHLIKAASYPDSPDFAHWRTEVRAFLADLRDDYTPSMRQRIEFDRVWADARAIAGDSLGEQGRGLDSRLPIASPLDIDAMVQPDFDFDLALRRLHGIMPDTM